ncbi:hypothetical protein IFM46972_11560 [Aspergillus udagawae]|uniref:Uncharacterized protein n=1 Tax=Aspergillus udagawae TaxID=91492 RepID=A0A8H3SH91_9EURO|nr:hypothetical protein IFM46972_11560 [Aspergillus udagawae]
MRVPEITLGILSTEPRRPHPPSEQGHRPTTRTGQTSEPLPGGYGEKPPPWRRLACFDFPRNTPCRPQKRRAVGRIRAIRAIQQRLQAKRVHDLRHDRRLHPQILRPPQEHGDRTRRVVSVSPDIVAQSRPVEMQHIPTRLHPDRLQTRRILEVQPASLFQRDLPRLAVDECDGRRLSVLVRYAVSPAGLTRFVAVEKEVRGVFFCYTMR